jgi:type IVB pilus formation R64 PilN family outer membrane protein
MNYSALTKAVLIAVALPLAACSTPPSRQQVVNADTDAATAAAKLVAGERTLSDHAGKNVRGGTLDADTRAAEQVKPAVLRRATHPWIGSTLVAVESNDRLPSVFTEPQKLAFDDTASGGKVSLNVIATRITKLTGVPVRVKNDVYSTVDGAQNASVQTAGVTVPAMDGTTRAVATIQRAGSVDQSLSAMEMRWNGSLQQFLEMITDRLGLSWEYRDGAVVIERFQTDFFEIAGFDNEGSYALGMSSSDQGQTGTGSSGGLSASNATSEVTEKGKSSAVSSILKGVNLIIAQSPGSSATISDGSGRMAVTTTKDAMARVRSYVRDENNAMQRQVQIQFDIYSVSHTADDEQGIDWTGVLSSISGTWGATMSSPTSLVSSAAGTVAYNILSGGTSNTSKKLGGTSSVLSLLSQYGTAVQHKPVSLLGLNRQWARKASLDSQAYVSEATAGSSTTTTTTSAGLKTSTVTTGDRFVAMPQILDNNTVLLKFGLGLATLVDIETFTSGSGSTLVSVQNPETTNIIDQSSVALRPGEILAITGISKVVTKSNRNTLGEDVPILAGGSKVISRDREDFIILVRATIL